MRLLFEDEEIKKEIFHEKMVQAAMHALELEELEHERCEISLSFVDEEEIHQLNNTYRGVDSPTDVLSFPQFEDIYEDLPEEGDICLGDVVICTDVAKKQAVEYGHSYERELVYLFVHSILHLLGYDHMEDEEKKDMRKREEEIMSHIGLERE